MQKLDMTPVQVVATAEGYDGVRGRKVGDKFPVPAHLLERKPKLGPDLKPVRDEKGNPTGELHDLPSWFKRVAPEPKKAAVPVEQASDESQEQSDPANDADLT